MPQSTSPVPAVARPRIVAVAHREPRRPGAATIVSAPFSTQTAPVRGASVAGRRRAGARRRSPVVPPSSRAASPACGVITVGAVRPASRLEVGAERVQAVGVEHERRRPDRGTIARTSAAVPGVAPAAGAERDRGRRARPAPGSRPRRRAARPPSAIGAGAASSASSSVTCDDRLLASRHAGHDDARAGRAAPPAAQSTIAPVMPRDPPTASTLPASYFEPPRGRGAAARRSRRRPPARPARAPPPRPGCRCRRPRPRRRAEAPGTMRGRAWRRGT